MQMRKFDTKTGLKQGSQPLMRLHFFNIPMAKQKRRRKGQKSKQGKHSIFHQSRVLASNRTHSTLTLEHTADFRSDSL
jgi:hypothetical protein